MFAFDFLFRRPKNIHKDTDNSRIELRASPVVKEAAGILTRKSGPVRSCAAKCIVSIRYREYTSGKRYIGTFQLFRISGPVPAFVMVLDRGYDRTFETDILQNRGSDR